MTFSYSLQISHAKFFSFSRLLVIWRASIYKLIWPELLVFLSVYYALAMIYRLGLTEEYQKEIFESVCVYAAQGLKVIPLSFLLGFYVSLVVGRWWNMYKILTWIDEFALVVSSQVHGTDNTTRMARRAFVRWYNLMSVLVYRAVSVPVLKRFPTMKHIRNAGLLTDGELKIYESVPSPHTKFWLPCIWAMNLATTLRDNKTVTKDLSHRYIMERFQVHRQFCQDILSYDWVSIPLVYTQVVTIACYTYFLCSVLGRQYLDPTRGYDSHVIDKYFPVLVVLEFFFYFGWMKVAQAIINPYGGDDDDFELNYIIDRNVQVGFILVDQLHAQIPNLEKDPYWDDTYADLPYTKSTMHLRRRRPWNGSTDKVKVNTKDKLVDSATNEIPGQDSVYRANDILYTPNKDGESFPMMQTQKCRETHSL
ncbi:bestrophin-3-like [Saccoglossus kowalevskii]|uniref:Bestrophin homolog n=1 Tax=Saccoglossus kowalevskii TaxID=10224 RepID=A0ABM0GQK0_SACKO|nr:PREDICTED: bestrophin-3-like [Saccoglossus kowalevskii]